MQIHAFVWPQDRIDHIDLHGVTPDEVEQACFGQALVQRAKSEGENPVYYVLGQTSDHGPADDRQGRAAIPPVEEPMSASRLPQTDSIQELVHFWDTHDVTELDDELEEVGDRVFERDTQITIHLESDDADAVRAAAASRGVRDSELLREWVIEKLHAA